MDDKAYFIDVKKSVPFIIAIIDKFMGNSYMCLEGDLSSVNFSKIDNVTREETSVLQWNTASPIQDYIVFPLTLRNVEIFRYLIPRVGIRSNVYHIEIELDGKLVFGAYDQLHKECTFISTSVGEEFLESLKKNNIIRKYELKEVSISGTGDIIEKSYKYSFTKKIKGYLTNFAPFLRRDR